MKFAEFVALRKSGEIENNVTWRGYDIPASVKYGWSGRALQVMGLHYLGEFALGEVAVRYQLTGDRQAHAYLGQWWPMRELAAGRRVRGLKPPQGSQKIGKPATAHPGQP